MTRTDMGFPLPCRLTPNLRARTGDWLAMDDGPDALLRVAVDDDGDAVVGWAAEPLDAARCDRVDLDAMTGAVREAVAP